LPAVRRGAGVALFLLRIPHVFKAVVALLLVSAFLVGVQGAENRLRRMDSFDIDPACMKIQEMPPWLDPDWAQTIRNPFMGRSHVNLFEPDLASKLYNAYRESPWIEGVCAVRKEFPDRLKIRIRIRTPLVAVPFGKKYMLVDGHGVLLPRCFSEVPDFGFPLRVVEGVTAAPPEAGSVWDSAPLRAGLQVAADLTATKKKAFERIVRIDVSLVKEGPVRGRTEILLFCAEGGGYIEWGSAPGHREGLEIPVDKKLENLERLLAECPDMRSIKHALIQFDDPWYKPLR